MKKIHYLFYQDLLFYKSCGLKSVLFFTLFTAIIAFFIAYRYLIDPWFFFSDGGDHPLFRPAYYPVAYFMAVVLVAAFFGKQDALIKMEFWLLSFFILLVLYLNHFLPLIPINGFPAGMHFYLDQLFYNIQCTFVYAAVPLFLWFFYHRKKQPEWMMYGFQYKKGDLKPYFILLLLMIPLLVWASLRSDFQSAYPRYTPGAMEKMYQLSPVITSGVFELSYITQFITLEWFFRGFMVLSLSRLFGAQAVWIMVAVYVFLHFGKPMHETIGSFFGAYILGTIAYHSKSIYGGVIIHVGIALLMELFAALW